MHLKANSEERLRHNNGCAKYLFEYHVQILKAVRKRCQMMMVTGLLQLQSRGKA